MIVPVVSVTVDGRTMRSADSSTTRELAQRLLACERLGMNAAVVDSRALWRVCDKLRRPLSTLAGAQGFRSLLARALTLAKQESSDLHSWEVTPDGSLDEANSEAGESGDVLISHLLGLMVTFIGDGLTFRLLRDVWPDLPSSETAIKGANQDE